MIFQNTSNARYEPSKEIIPRGDRSIVADSYIEIKEHEKMKFVFSAASGLKVILHVPPNISVKQLIRNYLKRVGLPDCVLEKDVIFLFNGTLINVDDKSLVKEVFKNTEFITVIDVGGVMGGKKYCL